MLLFEAEFLNKLLCIDNAGLSRLKGSVEDYLKCCSPGELESLHKSAELRNVKVDLLDHYFFLYEVNSNLVQRDEGENS